MIAPPSTAKTSKTLTKLFLYYNSLNKVTLLCKVSDWCVLLNLKKIQITYSRPATFCKSRAVTCMITCAMTCVGCWYFCTALLTLWLLSLKMEAAETNVCHGCLQNDNEELWVICRAMAVTFRMARDAGAAFITKNWVAAQLKRFAHFVHRNWHRSPHDLQTEFCGSCPLVLSQDSCDVVGQNANRQRKCLWMLLLLLLAATRITNCNSWFF